MQAAQRFALAVILVALAVMMSGCSSARRHFSSSSSGAPFAVDPSCRVGNTCMYNGHYDPGERSYAEQEAQRLNEAEYQRLIQSGK